MVEHCCTDCRNLVEFPDHPGDDAVCPHCRVKLYINEKDQIGAYPPDDWEPGRIQGWRKD
jgi:DNA-directed RNA polymerase subunit RPC12/RpoP